MGGESLDHGGYGEKAGDHGDPIKILYSRAFPVSPLVDALSTLRTGKARIAL